MMASFKPMTKQVSTTQGFDPRASRGLFVGVSVFEDEKLAPVPFAVDDAVDLAHLFAVELGLVEPGHVALALAGEPAKAASGARLEELRKLGARREKARKPDVLRLLSQQASHSGESGLLVVSAATHGLAAEGQDYLVTLETLFEDPVDTGVALTKLLTRVQGARAARRLVLLDACRERLRKGARELRGPGLAESFADAIGNATGQVVLAGATAGGYAYDDTESQNGVFSAAVVAGLKGEAAPDGNGWITARTLGDYVQRQVVAWVRQHRPEDAALSRGIARTIEGEGEALPLVEHPRRREDTRVYLERRERAVVALRACWGQGVLPGALLDLILEQLPAGGPAANSAAWFGEIEELDGGAKSQRLLRDFAWQQGLWGEGEARGRAMPVMPEGDASAGPTPAGRVGVSPSGMRFRYVPAGTYTVGSPEDEEGREKDEYRHQVHLTRGFWLGETLVTQAQWQALSLPNPATKLGAYHPVEKVNWFEAVAFANRLSERERLEPCYELEGVTGQLGEEGFGCKAVRFKGLNCTGYRLPTEHEWEVAARADPEGNAAIYGANLDEIAWYAKNRGGSTRPVGGRRPNAWGFHDLLGNVFEWVWDFYGGPYQGLLTDPLGAGEGTIRVLRGGSWDSDARKVRAAYRFGARPSSRLIFLGFRLARGSGG